MSNIGAQGRILSLLSLCRRAAKLSLGFDKVMDTVNQGVACGVFVTADISAKTAKNVEFICEREGIQVTQLPITMDEVEKAVGKRSGVISIADQGLSLKLKSLLQSKPAVSTE